MKNKCLTCAYAANIRKEETINKKECLIGYCGKHKMTLSDYHINNLSCNNYRKKEEKI